MGGFAFEDLDPTRIVSLRDFARDFWAQRARRPLVALDMSSHIVQVGTEARSRQSRVSHQTLVRRFAALLKVGYILVGVFDGPLDEEKLRHRALLDPARRRDRATREQVLEISDMRQFGPMVRYARRACSALGITKIEAPAEAEALCAWLQREGHVDAVFSADADVLANGATCVLRYLPAQHPACVKVSYAEDRMLAVYELKRKDAQRFAMMALILGDDWTPGVPRIGKATASALSQPHTGFAARLAELVDLAKQHGQHFFGVELKRLQFHDDFAAELATNEHGWLAKKQRRPIPDWFPDIARFARLMNPADSYDEKFAAACADARTSTGLLPIHQQRLAELTALWAQPDPELESTMEEFGMSDLETRLASRNRAADEQSSKLFRSTVAPLLVANMLMQRRPETELMEFKEARRGLDVAVVSAIPVPPFDTRFLVGARVARFIFDRCDRRTHLQTTRRTTPAKHAANKASKQASDQNSSADARENSTITQYFGKRPRENSDTDDDEVRPTEKQIKSAEARPEQFSDEGRSEQAPDERRSEQAPDERRSEQAPDEGRSEEQLFVSDEPVDEPALPSDDVEMLESSVELLESSDVEPIVANVPDLRAEDADESDIEVLGVTHLG